MEVFKLSDPLYERDIVILVGENEVALGAYLKKEHGESVKIYNKENAVDNTPDPQNDGCQFNVRDDVSQTFYVWIARRDIALLHHEMQHLTFDIMDAVGMSYCDESEEAYTYFGAHLFKQAVELIFPVVAKDLV